MIADLPARCLRSVAARMVVLVVAFAAVPVVLSARFLDAETAKRATLLHMAQAEGHLIAEGLRVALERTDHPPSVVETRQLVERINASGITMRLLLRPAGDPAAVYLVAAAPPLAPDAVDTERHQLLDAGIVAQIPRSCDGATPLDLRYTAASRQEEVLSSITPFANEVGCWAIITSHSGTDAVGSLLGRPYWQAPEVTLGAIIYGVLAMLVISLFAGLWRGLVLFGRQARSIGSEGGASSFADNNGIPELAGVAQEFDRMVASLRASAEAAHRAAEDNAHAFKTPLATIAQSLEPVRRGLAEDDLRAHRSLHLIEQSVMRLDALVSAARRMDEANANLVNPPHQRIDLSKLTTALLDTYEDIAAEQAVRMVTDIAGGCWVWAGAELMETVIENIIDNAISFAPPRSCIVVRLSRSQNKVVLAVEDEGPGVTAEVMATMFDRYVSRRPSSDGLPGEQHFGIGLWVVRRNVESVGGSVQAENRNPGGLRMIVTLTAAR